MGINHISRNSETRRVDWYGFATAKRFVQERMDHFFIAGRQKDAQDRAAAEIGPRDFRKSVGQRASELSC